MESEQDEDDNNNFSKIMADEGFNKKFDNDENGQEDEDEDEGNFAALMQKTKGFNGVDSMVMRN